MNKSRKKQYNKLYKYLQLLSDHNINYIAFDLPTCKQIVSFNLEKEFPTLIIRSFCNIPENHILITNYNIQVSLKNLEKYLKLNTFW